MADKLRDTNRLNTYEKPSYSGKPTYLLSYPRSGSNWFRYCFEFITNTEVDRDLLFHSHSLANDQWNIKKHHDVKSIFLIRNYKECLISEMKFHYIRTSESMKLRLAETGLTIGSGSAHLNSSTVFECENIAFFMENMIEIVKHVASEISPEFDNWKPEHWIENSGNSELTQNNAAYNAMCNVEIKHRPDHDLYYLEAYYNWAKNDVYYALREIMDNLFSDFLLSGFPIFETDHADLKMSRYPIESVLSLSAANHYYFALQLIRYYELLEYYDKTHKMKPNNTLLIKYEDFMEDPFAALNQTIDFVEQSYIATPNQLKQFRENLDKFMNDIDMHKDLSVTKLREDVVDQGLKPATSYKRDPLYNFHSSMCRKEFLVQIDEVLKNKNLELYNKYLSEYEETERQNKHV